MRERRQQETDGARKELQGKRTRCGFLVSRSLGLCDSNVSLVA